MLSSNTSGFGGGIFDGGTYMPVAAGASGSGSAIARCIYCLFVDCTGSFP